MRFATILLLATAVSAVRIQQKATAEIKKGPPTPGEIFDYCSKIDKDDKLLTKDEAMKCIDGALEKKLISE